MTNLYTWLRFLHLVGVGAFLFGHGASGAASFALRGRPGADVSRSLLQLSTWSYRVTWPGFLLLLVTGVWMGFAGHWWGQGWIWAAIAVLVLSLGLMGWLSAPYHAARDAAAEPDTALRERLDRTRPRTAAAIGGIALVALFFLMVFKPF